jgi:hypothetical protein
VQGASVHIHRVPHRRCVCTRLHACKYEAKLWVGVGIGRVGGALLIGNIVHGLDSSFSGTFSFLHHPVMDGVAKPFPHPQKATEIARPPSCIGNSTSLF